MNKLFKVILLSVSISCNVRKAPNHLIKGVIYKDSAIISSISKYNRPSDTLDNVYYDFIINNQKRVLIEFNKENAPLYIREVDKLYRDLPGVKLIFNEKSGRLEQLFFTDSSYFIEGPLYMYKRNGKIKHLLLMHRGSCKKVIYTSSPKQLENDTAYFNIIRFQINKYRKEYGW